MIGAGAHSIEPHVAPPRAETHIDIDAYRHNIATLRARLSSGTQLWAVIKADAYGHGMSLVATEAVAAGARRLCVATLSEARHLRQVDGLRVPILVMGPLDPASIRRAIDLDVSFAAVHDGMIEALHQLAHDGEIGPSRQACVHLKVDTGMGRWGVPYAVYADRLARLADVPGVDLEGVMTHFATADDLDDSFFDAQLARFVDVVDVARRHSPTVVAHAANSAATLRTTDAHFDAVRCGVATFGLDPMQRDAARHGLRPVMSLRSYVADVRELAPGQSTGYERRFVATSPTLIAKVPIGYADGVRRSLGAGNGHVLIHGRARTIVGNVSMDHVSVRVDESVRRGDIVTLIGADDTELVTVEEHAAWAGTINYEITCGIADEPRLVRTHTET